MIKVSIIITTFGKPIFLKQSLQSVKNQTFKEIELIVVDDNDSQSEDRKDTQNLIKEFKKSIDFNLTYIEHPKNMNGAVARNTGIREAQGRYIAFLDSDDFYHPSRLEKCYNKIKNVESSFAGVYTGCEFRRQGRKYDEFKNPIRGNHLISTLAGKFKFSTGSNIFIRRDIIEELGGFDESFIRHQDYEFLVRFFERYNLEAIQEVLVVKNNDNFNLPDISQLIKVKEKYLHKYSQIINCLEIDLRNFIFKSSYVYIAERALNVGNFGLGRKYYKKAKTFQGLTILEKLRRFGFFLKNKFKK